MSELDKLTIGEFKEISAFLSNKKEPFPYNIGDNVFIRTVTMYYVGKINNLLGQWIVLSNAVWVSDTGVFHNFLKDGTCIEYEGFIDDMSVHINSIIDITIWKHNLFSGQN